MNLLSISNSTIIDILKRQYLLTEMGSKAVLTIVGLGPEYTLTNLLFVVGETIVRAYLDAVWGV